MFERELHQHVADAMHEIIKEIEKDLPEEVVKDLREMASIQAGITKRLHTNRAIEFEKIQRYNELCYKNFGKIQDGGEFTKVERPGDSKIEFRPLKLRDQEPAEAPGIKVHKAVPYNMPAGESVHRFYFNGKSFDLIPEAQWIRMSDGDAPYSCSNCCRTGRKTKFCPHCGARMED